METNENQCKFNKKTMNINEIKWKSMKINEIHENQWTSMKINEISYKFNEN